MRGRAHVFGAMPEKVYVVSFNGKQHKLYSSLSTARGVRTSYLNARRNVDSESIKIYEIDVTDGKEVK